MIASDPWAGLLPVQAGAARLEAVDPGPLALLAPWPRAEEAMNAALRAAHGPGFPAPGRIETSGAARAIWFGRGQALLAGVVPDPSLRAHGLVEDQSDGWVVARLTGDGALDVLARLVPVDLRRLGPKGVVRTMLGHMNVAILGTSGGVEILAFRSMAGTLAHEIADAMRAVAGRAALG
nr:sarcosine oxidase subunit gamma [Thetidibacter halocola]